MNNGSTLPTTDDNSNLTVAVNSIQRTLFVERLYVPVKYPADRIIPYDVDNLYPNKIKSIAQRSGTVMSAIGTLSSFISGEGFANMNAIVNEDGQTLWDILRHICNSRAMFGGFALHVNYNLLGKIYQIYPVNFEFVRWSRDLKNYVVNPDWFRRNRRNEETVYNPFNPDTALEEMQAAGGYQNYKGQLYYWIPNKKDWYCTTHWDSVLDDAQFEAECKLYSLSSVQNDYSLGGYLVYPKALTDANEISEIKNELKTDKGSSNAGGTRVFGVTPSEGLANWKYFVPVSRNNIDQLHTNQIERAKFNIYAEFRQPPILNGVTKDGMFNQESFADAFHYYNSSTETERKEVEKELNKILKFSAWASLGKVKITPKKFSVAKEQLTAEEITQKSIETRETAQATLRSTVGGVQGILSIQAGVVAKTTTVESAITMLIEIYGFSQDAAIKMIGQPQQKTPQNG
jgi:hypothetical protein